MQKETRFALVLATGLAIASLTGCGRLGGGNQTPSSSGSATIDASTSPKASPQISSQQQYEELVQALANAHTNFSGSLNAYLIQLQAISAETPEEQKQKNSEIDYSSLDEPLKQLENAAIKLQNQTEKVTSLRQANTLSKEINGIINQEIKAKVVEPLRSGGGVINLNAVGTVQDKLKLFEKNEIAPEDRGIFGSKTYEATSEFLNEQNKSLETKIAALKQIKYGESGAGSANNSGKGTGQEQTQSDSLGQEQSEPPLGPAAVVCLILLNLGLAVDRFRREKVFKSKLDVRIPDTQTPKLPHGEERKSQPENPRDDALEKKVDKVPTEVSILLPLVSELVEALKPGDRSNGTHHHDDFNTYLEELKEVLLTLNSNVENLQGQVGNLSNCVDALNRKEHGLKNISPSGTDSHSSNHVERTEYQRPNPESSYAGSSNEQDEVAKYYNHNPTVIEREKVETVGETALSKENRHVGQSSTPSLEKNHQGDYWVIQRNGKYYLVPKQGAKFNQYTLELLRALYQYSGDDGNDQTIRLIRAATVSPNGDTWVLQSQGELKFVP